MDGCTQKRKNKPPLKTVCKKNKSIELDCSTLTTDRGYGHISCDYDI